MADDTIEQPLKRRIGPYELIREAGRGGMSTVYEAVDTRDGRLVALKALVPTPHLSEEEQHKHLTRLQREADAVARLHHPNLVNVLDMGTVGDTPETRTHYLVLEYVKGETLGERLSRTGPLPLAETTAIVEQIAGALDAAHASGVIHRDVKPGNIMIQPDGTAKLMDFGVARLTDDTDVTRPGTIIGSPAYMSPEQAKGEAVTAASDQWSLAAVLYAMLSGRSPFAAENIPATLYQVTHGIAGPIPDVSPAVMRVFARAFDRNAAHRFPSGSALVAAFKDALSGRNPAVYPVAEAPTVMPIVGTPAAGGGPRRRGAIHPVLAWLPVAAVALLIAFLFSASMKPQKKQADTRSVVTAADPTATPSVAPTALPTRGITSVPPGPRPLQRRVASVSAVKPSPTFSPTASPTPTVLLPEALPTPTALPTPARRLPSPTPHPRATPPPVAIIVERTPATASPRTTPSAPPSPAPVLVAKTVPTPPPTVTPRREGTATSALKPATPAPTPTPGLAATPQPTPSEASASEEADNSEPSATVPASEDNVSFLGIWRGKHTGSPATLVIKSENAESDSFNGILTVQTAAGAVAIAVRGHLYDNTGSPEVVLEEQRVVAPSTPRVWDLGMNTGRLNGPDAMSGSGHDHRGRTYSWSFHR